MHLPKDMYKYEQFSPIHTMKKLFSFAEYIQKNQLSSYVCLYKFEYTIKFYPLNACVTRYQVNKNSECTRIFLVK